MSHLSVVVWDQQRVVVTRHIPLVHRTPLGAHPGSPVPFPHGTVWVELVGDAWLVGAVLLPEGRPLRMPVGPYELEVQRVSRRPATFGTAWASNHRTGIALWLVTVALSLLAAQAGLAWHLWGRPSH